MRTTLAIDDDALTAAIGLATMQQKSVGAVLSELARQSLRPTPGRGKFHNGVPLLPNQATAGLVTLEANNALRDESP